VKIVTGATFAVQKHNNHISGENGYIGHQKCKTQKKEKRGGEKHT
jgi:hypothetical protein